MINTAITISWLLVTKDVGLCAALVQGAAALDVVEEAIVEVVEEDVVTADTISPIGST